MPAIDPVTGVPILGTLSPQEQRAKQIGELLAEKETLAEKDHDWIVVVTYALSNESAERAGVAEMTGVPAKPPIPLMHEVIVATTPVLCRKCEMPWVGTADKDCPGISLREYLGTLDEETRAEVLRRLEETPEGAQFDVEDDGTVTVVADGPNGVVAMEYQAPEVWDGDRREVFDEVTDFGPEQFKRTITTASGDTLTLTEAPLPGIVPDVEGRDL